MKNRLKVARAEIDLTQEDLAHRIGVSRQSINAIESGRYVPSTVLALKMAQVFGKPVEEIFFLEETDWCLTQKSQNTQKPIGRGLIVALRFP